jgi:hypothetical protein
VGRGHPTNNRDQKLKPRSRQTKGKQLLDDVLMYEAEPCALCGRVPSSGVGAVGK